MYTMMYLALGGFINLKLEYFHNMRYMCEMYPINKKGCIVQKLVHYCIQVNWNYVSLNGSSNCKILLLCINLWVGRLWLCMSWNGGGAPTLKKAGDCWRVFQGGRGYHGWTVATTTACGGSHSLTMASFPWQACMAFLAVGITGDPWCPPRHVVT